MKLEILNKKYIKRIIIGNITIISIALVGILSLNLTKYKNNAMIKSKNYELNNDNMMAIKIKNDNGEYVETPSIPIEGYEINSEETYCKVNGEVDKSVTIELDGTKIWLDNIKKNTKCYLYFDKKASAGDTILAGMTPNSGSDSFTGPETENAGIFTGTDDDGTTYYYRGAVTNNHLKFANKWWRIVRINGDGTIRIIYDGTAYHANGTSTSDSIAVTSTAFNPSANDNAYVGFKYGATGQSTYAATHANTNKSTILTALETWYSNNLASYKDYIDTNAWFCNDRSINTGSTTWWSKDTKKGYGTNATAYGPWSRIMNSNASWNSTQTPTFNCLNSNDLFTVSGANKGNKSLTYPIGLITADEVIYAGGFGGSNNTSYYLYNGQEYWTMSPTDVGTIGYACVFYVNSNGTLYDFYYVNYTYGVRPVINLRADVPITGSGTQNDPFIVN